LGELLFVVLPELERRRTARLERRADRKRKLVANDGRPRAATPVHKVLMTLIYLRHNVQHEVVGAWKGERGSNRREKRLRSQTPFLFL